MSLPSPPDAGPGQSPADAKAIPPVRSAEVSAAGRGGIAILGAKLYFVLIGLVQQIALKAVRGLAGYGAYSTAQAVASITYNPVVQASIQGVSRTLAAADPAERPTLLRQTLRLHATWAGGLALVFFILAGPMATLLGAPHLVGSIRILAAIVLVYGLYAPLIGALNGQKRFLAQALFGRSGSDFAHDGSALGSMALHPHAGARRRARGGGGQYRLRARKPADPDDGAEHHGHRSPWKLAPDRPEVCGLHGAGPRRPVPAQRLVSGGLPPRAPFPRRGRTRSRSGPRGRRFPSSEPTAPHRCSAFCPISYS